MAGMRFVAFKSSAGAAVVSPVRAGAESHVSGFGEMIKSGLQTRKHQGSIVSGFFKTVRFAGFPVRGGRR
jgi:hypothetical protein